MRVITVIVACALLSGCAGGSVSGRSPDTTSRVSMEQRLMDSPAAIHGIDSSIVSDSEVFYSEERCSDGSSIVQWYRWDQSGNLTPIPGEPECLSGAASVDPNHNTASAEPSAAQ